MVENRTGVCKRMKLYWANEVGRTILTLVQRAKDTIFTSPFFTTALGVGTKTVNIQMKSKERAKRCPTSEQVFDSLLHQLSHNDDTHSFKLCKTHKIRTTHYTTYNCCRVVGKKNLTLCADYSSPIVKYASPVVIVIFCISCLMVIPFVLQYVMTYPKTKFYKMSDSPMSLLSIASRIFVEGRGPFQSLFRRGVFVGLSYFVLFFPNFFGFEWLKYLFYIWLALFLLFNDIQMTYQEGQKACVQQRREKHKCESKCNDCINECEKCFAKLQLDVKLISCFAIPFCLLRGAPGCVTSNKLKKFDKSGFLFDLLYNFFIVIQGICVGFSIIIALIIYTILVACCLVKFFMIDFFVFFIWPHHSGVKVLQKVIFPLRLLTLLIFVFLTGMVFISVLFSVVSLALNAEFFSPFIAPILAVIVYFLKNWRWSVEAKCVLLKKLIIEVSKEKVASQNNEVNLLTHKSTKSKSTCKDQLVEFLCPCLQDNIKTKNDKAVDEEGSSLIDQNSSSSQTSDGYNVPSSKDLEGNKRKNIIKFDKHGEAIISKKLYKTISQNFRHLDRLLFYFFRRVLFVGLYAICMLMVMILARDSGVSGIVQIVSGILGVLVPFVFDSIFAEHHLSQRISEEVGMRQKLKHILKVKEQENNTILVELKDPSENGRTETRRTEKPGDQSGTAETLAVGPEKPNDQLGAATEPVKSDNSLPMVPVSPQEEPNEQSGSAEDTVGLGDPSIVVSTPKDPNHQLDT